jgi:DNA-binding IclR family transcriptional regulator
MKTGSTFKSQKTNSGYKPLVPAVEQAAKVLICLGNSSKFKMTLTEICTQVGIHKSKAYSILNTLKLFGFVNKDAKTKAYSLGTGLLFLARNVLDNLDLRETAAPFLESLARETHSTALLGVVSAEQVFVVAKHEDEQSIGVTIRLGHRFHLTAGSHGKAIVAFMPQNERRRILARKKLFFYGDPARMNLKRLREEFAQCQSKGFASDLGELQPGINAVSAPIFGLNRSIIGCIILIGTFAEEFIEPFGYKTAEMAMQISYHVSGEA